MAAPETATLKNLNGTWVMNKTLSSPSDPPLTLQGISWLLRKAIGLATITLHITTYTDPADSSFHIDIVQPGVGNLGGTTEKRVLDSSEREHTDHIFGHVKGRSSWVTLEEVGMEDKEDEAWLKEGWLEPKEEDEGKFVKSYVESVGNGWTATQIWGFAMIGEERRYVRRAVVRKGPKVERVRLVYDYKGERPAGQ
ncbi:hypothetical protein K402DRAFT_345665 [Aulographum hederae CBS 113979]|uniref:LCCL domain-containing protein n=1 Tax=Aulographum hederae CBS 113979 TaxID=1176131 RepID=A0A6G1HGI5_9PEZI|nr:hypothetical protein K402DRAFT_345665 [Aulographum hederae CBS 113979]